MGLRHEAEVLGAPSTSLRARTACLALQGPAAGPTRTEARERGSGTRKLSHHPQHNLEVESRYSARWKPWHTEPQTPAERSFSSLCKVVCLLSPFPLLLGLRAGERLGGKEQASRRNWRWGRTSVVETAWETGASSFTQLDVPLNNLTLLPKDLKEPWLGGGTADKLSCSVGGTGECRSMGLPCGALP